MARQRKQRNGPQVYQAGGLQARPFTPLNFQPTQTEVRRPGVAPLYVPDMPMRRSGGGGSGVGALGPGIENAAAAISDAIIKKNYLKEDKRRYDEAMQRSDRDTGVNTLSSIVANSVNAMQVAAEAHTVNLNEQVGRAETLYDQLALLGEIEDGMKTNNWTTSHQAVNDLQTQLATEAQKINDTARNQDMLRMQADQARAEARPQVDAKGRPIQPSPTSQPATSQPAATQPAAPSPTMTAHELRDIHDNALMAMFEAAQSNTARDSFDHAQWSGASLAPSFAKSLVRSLNWAADPLGDPQAFADNNTWDNFFSKFTDKKSGTVDWTPVRDMLNTPSDQFLSKVGKNTELYGTHADSGGLVFGSAARNAAVLLGTSDPKTLAISNRVGSDKGPEAKTFGGQFRIDLYNEMLDEIGKQGSVARAKADAAMTPGALFKTGIKNLPSEMLKASTSSMPLGEDIRSSQEANTPWMGQAESARQLESNFTALSSLTPAEINAGAVEPGNELKAKGIAIYNNALKAAMTKATDAHVRSYFGLPGVKDAYQKATLRAETSDPAFQSRVAERVASGEPAKSAYTRTFLGDRTMSVLLSTADSDPNAKQVLEQIRESSPDIYYGYLSSRSEDPYFAPYAAKFTEINNDDNPVTRRDRSVGLGDEITLKMLQDKANILHDPEFSKTLSEIQQNRLDPNYQSSGLSAQDHTRMSSLAHRYIGADWLPKAQREMLGAKFLSKPVYADAVSRRKAFLESELNVANQRINDIRSTPTVPPMDLHLDDGFKKQLGPYAPMYESNLRQIGDALRNSYGQSGNSPTTPQSSPPIPQQNPATPQPRNIQPQDQQQPAMNSE